MATWQQYDGVESRVAKAGAGVVDLIDHLRDHFPSVDTSDVMDAAKVLTDHMRRARAAAMTETIAERGHRR